MAAPTVTSIRQGLSTAVQTVPGLRASATIVDNITPPQAVVFPPTVEYDMTFGRGRDRMEFAIRVFVAGNLRNADELLDSYCRGSGTTSVKTAVETDRTLGGVVQDCRVTRVRPLGAEEVGSLDYLAVEFTVDVIALGS